jgi:hypothetical protein
MPISAATPRGECIHALLQTPVSCPSRLAFSTHSRRHFEVSDALEARASTCPIRRAVFDCGDKEATVSDRADDIYFDGNGVLTERQRLGGEEVVVHYDDIPEKDVTTVNGIPCTTALRTVIDIAPDLERVQLGRVVQDCLDRHLFSLEEARARLLEPDMTHRRGAGLLRRLLFG